MHVVSFVCELSVIAVKFVKLFSDLAFSEDEYEGEGGVGDSEVRCGVHLTPCSATTIRLTWQRYISHSPTCIQVVHTWRVDPALGSIRRANGD